jgi:predicted metal-dependent phosphoesterase TrpH
MFSHCSIARPDRIILRAARLGLSAIAVLDHNEVAVTSELIAAAGDLKRRRAIPDNFLIIPGSEISSAVGHVGALFVEERIPDGLSCEETVRLIHEAGGLAVAPHPYHSTGIGDAVFDAPFDAIETSCGSVFNAKQVKMNVTLASDTRLAKAAKLGASDAHYTQAIGACYTILQVGEPTLGSVREAIVTGRTTPIMSRPYLRIQKLLGGVSRLS